MESPEIQPEVQQPAVETAPVEALDTPTAEAPASVPALKPSADSVSIYATGAAFDHGQRIARALAASTMVPTAYQKNLPNALVALEMANRMNLSPLAVMQNLDIIHGRPSWKSTFIISAINTCGKFYGLRFQYSGEGDTRSCYAYAKSREDGEIISGPPMSIKTAKSQGWYSKNGSKWPDMPDLMLSYRAATLFGRLYAPEILNGMPTVEETYDIGYEPVSSGTADRRAALNAKLVSSPPQAAPIKFETTDAVTVESGDLGI